MRVLAIVKASKESESGGVPDAAMLREMTTFNERLAKAGVLIAGEGLLPSSKGVRVRFEGDDDPTVINGPFSEPDQLVAGFWVLETRSIDEAVDWIKRAPFPTGEIEIRPIQETTDFAAFAPDVVARERALHMSIHKH